MTIKLKEMKKILMDYQLYFPGWLIMDKDVLFRRDGPILQGIMFDRSIRDIYRPTSFMRILCTPYSSRSGVMAQRLRHLNGAPDRSVSFESHSKIFAEISKEMKKQFEPDISHPLLPNDILNWYKQKALPTIVESADLASLHAYLGFLEEAKKWCNRFYQLRDKNPLYKGDPLHVPFVEQLINWIDSGQVRTNLDGIIDAEIKKLGIIE